MQQYFRRARPELARLGFQQDELEVLDSPFQELLRLSNGLNAAASYKKQLRAIRKALPKISGKIEIQLGASGADDLKLTSAELQIVGTLSDLVPSAAMSYKQAVADLADKSRISFRGPAVELREALRELLDHLAPDATVMKADGFKLEKDRTKPTMKQRVAFILRARGRSRSTASVPQDSLDAIEAAIGGLARSVYNQGSLATHVSTSRQEVIRLKRYVEAVLLDVLEL